MKRIFVRTMSHNTPKPTKTTGFIHRRARLDHPAYTKFEKYKFKVPEEKTLWSVDFPEYKPVEFTHPRILEQPDYADPQDPKKIDWSKKRFSMEYTRQGLKKMNFEENGRPINPIGRTGMRGRGRMGKWGPNMAADMLVARHIEGEPDVKEFVAIQRSDTGIFALPGGMVDGVAELFKGAAVREFFEEAAADNEFESQLIALMLEESQETYAGYVDDNRATDNVWTETAVYTFFYDEKKHPKLELKHADDAIGVRWLRTDDELFNDRETFHEHHREFVLQALLSNKKRKHDDNKSESK